jgi:hypothetical protein
MEGAKRMKESQYYLPMQKRLLADAEAVIPVRGMHGMCENRAFLRVPAGACRVQRACFAPHARRSVPDLYRRLPEPSRVLFGHCWRVRQLVEGLETE